MLEIDPHAQPEKPGPQPRKTRDPQLDWLKEEQSWAQDPDTGSASGFGQTDGENGGNRG